MSMKHKENITCPKCGKESEFTLWQSINTMIDPEMKNAVRDRSAFRFTCAHCGHTANVDYPFLYHQMEDRIMVQYAASDEAAQETCKLFTGGVDDKMEMLKDLIKDKYLRRIVRSQNQLLEKLAIFDAGMDDRLVEIFKVFLMAEFMKQHPDAGAVELLLYTDKDQKHIIEVLGDGRSLGGAELTDEMYNAVKQQFSSSLKDIRDDDPIINQEWALGFLSRSRNHES